MVDPLLNKLADQGGILGTLCAILLIALFYLAKLLLAEKDKRIADANRTQINLVDPLRRTAESIERMEGKIRVAKGEQ